MSSSQKLKHLGNRLLSCISSVQKLLEQLDKLELLLSTVDQCPTIQIQESLVPSMKALISNEILRHTDDDVRISVTSCIIEVTRITAPDSPYDDEQMKEVFRLIVAAFEKLSCVSGRGYEKALTILDNISKTKLCLLMLDLECDDLVVEMFQHFLRNIRSNHTQNAIDSMESIMTTVLDESEEISSDLMRPLLDSVKKENQTISPISWTLGEKVITNCAVKLKPYLMREVESSGRALNEYAQIVTCICKNESESLRSDHSNGPNMTVAVENKPGEPKDADEQPCDVTKGPELDVTSMKDAQIMDDSLSSIRSADASTMGAEVIKKSGSKRKSPSGLTKNSKTSNAKLSSKTENSESILVLESEIPLNAVPRKRCRRPNSLLNAEEGYDPSWIHLGTRTEKSAQSSKACDSSSAVPPSVKPTSRKDSLHPELKTGSDTLVSVSKDEDMEEPGESRRTNDTGTDLPPNESHVYRKDNVFLKPEDKRKACEGLASKHKTNDNADSDPSFSKENIRDGRHTKRGKKRKISGTGNQDILSNSVPMLKEGNLNLLPEKTSLGSPGVRLGMESEIRKDSEINPGTSIRRIRLKIDGKTVVARELADSKMESKLSCEGEGKHESPAYVEVENREEGRSSAQTRVKKTRKLHATANKGLNKSSTMKEPIMKSASKTSSGVEESQETPQAMLRGREVTRSAEASEIHDLGNSLVGRRIKVWWPMDQMFYEGVVDSYDPSIRKHLILYDDGDKEVLNLKRERWELVADDVSLNKEEGDAPQNLAEASDMTEKIKEKSELELLKGANTSSRSSKGGTSAKISKSGPAKSAVKFADTSAVDQSTSANASVDDPPRTVGGKDSARKPKTKRMKKTGSGIKKNKPETDKLGKKKASGSNFAEGNA